MQQNIQLPQKNQQGGYTLVELAIAVAILAVLIVSGLSGVQGILTSGKVNDQIKTVAKLNSKVSANFSSTTTSGITSATVANLGGWESSKFTVTSGVASIKSAFNTAEFLSTNTGAVKDMAANAGFLYTITGVPTAACPDLANGLNSLTYGISIQTAAPTPGAITTYPSTNLVKPAGGSSIDATTLANACSQAGVNAYDFVIALKP